MKSSLILAALAAFFLTMCTFTPAANAAPATLNMTSVLDYGDQFYNTGGVGTTAWVALPGQPTKTFHKMCVQDTGGGIMELGNGASPSITRQFVIPKTSGASAVPVCYPLGLTYLGSSVSIWIRTVKGGQITAGQNIINFLY